MSAATQLFDSTSAVNTAITTPEIDTRECNLIAVEVLPSGAAGAATISLFDVGLSTTAAIAVLATPASALVKTCAWGTGCEAGAATEYVGGRPTALPPRIQVSVAALGAGVTARLRVVGRYS